MSNERDAKIAELAERARKLRHQAGWNNVHRLEALASAANLEFEAGRLNQEAEDCEELEMQLVSEKLVEKDARKEAAQ